MIDFEKTHSSTESDIIKECKKYLKHYRRTIKEEKDTYEVEQKIPGKKIVSVSRTSKKKESYKIKTKYVDPVEVVEEMDIIETVNKITVRPILIVLDKLDRTVRNVSETIVGKTCDTIVDYVDTLWEDENSKEAYTIKLVMLTTKFAIKELLKIED